MEAVKANEQDKHEFTPLDFVLVVAIAIYAIYSLIVLPVESNGEALFGLMVNAVSAVIWFSRGRNWWAMVPTATCFLIIVGIINGAYYARPRQGRTLDGEATQSSMTASDAPRITVTVRAIESEPVTIVDRPALTIS